MQIQINTDNLNPLSSTHATQDLQLAASKAARQLNRALNTMLAKVHCK